MTPLPADDLPEETETLYDRGNVYVTQAAAASYAAVVHASPEEARRALTWLLLDARCIEEGEGTRPSKWRRRSRSSGVDVTAHVTEEPARPGLLVVVSAHVRPFSAGQRGGAKRSIVG